MGLRPAGTYSARETALGLRPGGTKKQSGSWPTHTSDNAVEGLADTGSGTALGSAGDRRAGAKRICLMPERATVMNRSEESA